MWKSLDHAEKLIKDHDAPKNTWRMARVLEVNCNARGQATSVKLQTPKGRPIHRSLRNIALLESDMTVKGPKSDDRRDHHVVMFESEGDKSTSAAQKTEMSSGPRRSKRLQKLKTKD